MLIINKVGVCYVKGNPLKNWRIRKLSKYVFSLACSLTFALDGPVFISTLATSAWPFHAAK